MTRTRAHASKTKTRGRKPSLAVIAVSVAVVAAVVGGTAAVLAVGRHPGRSSTSPHSSRPSTGREGGSSTARSGSGAHKPVKVEPLLVSSISPASGAQNVTFQPTITVNLSEPIADGSALPVLSPAIPGAWTHSSPTTLVFRPTAQLAPYSTVHLSIPGGPSGLRDRQGAVLSSTVRSSFTVEAASTLRLEQLLAELGYLPVTFVRSAPAPTGPAAAPAHTANLSADVLGASPSSSPAQQAINAEPTAADQVPLAPQPGRFTWRFADTPASLKSLWVDGEPNVVLRGAVMTFESTHGLGVDGDAGPIVWHALLADVAARRLDTSPYNYLMVSETLPESLTVWQNGKTLLDYPANTGIPAAPTATGTFPVYARYLVTTMSGTEPNGQKYSDPGIPWVSYFNGGDAVHGYIRPGYGYPQSLGCVELTYADAKVVFNYDPLGTLVTVSA